MVYQIMVERFIKVMAIMQTINIRFLIKVGHKIPAIVRLSIINVYTE